MDSADKNSKSSFNADCSQEQQKKDQNLCRAETRKNKNKGQVETRTINTQGNEARGKPVGNETKEVKLNTGHMSRETTKIK